MTAADAPPQYLIDGMVRVAVPEMAGAAAGYSSSGARQTIFTANVKQPAAEWLRETVTEVEELTSLAADWNGYGAVSVDAGAAIAAVQFLLRAALPRMSRPDIVPVADGGVQVEWHRGGVDFEVSFSPDESCVFVEDSAGGEAVEAPSESAIELLSRYEVQLRDA